MNATIDKKFVDKLVNELINNFGFTYNVKTQQALTGPYYLVSLEGHEVQINVIDIEELRCQIINYLTANFAKLNENGNHIGAWIDKGIVYLDITEAIHQRYKTQGTVNKIAKERNQLAYFDLLNKETIYVK